MSYAPLSPLLLAALILTVFEIAGGRPRIATLRLPRLSAAAAAAGACALIAGFLVQLLLLADQALHDGARPQWVTHTPYLLVYPVPPPSPQHWFFSLGALGAAVVQTLGLGTVVAALLQRRDDEGDGAARLARALTPLLAIVLAGLALWSPAVSSSDSFVYVGLGMLGPHPFERPQHFFSGEYAAVFRDWPLPPTVYGPLWCALNAGVVALGSTFAAKVLALRVFGTVLLVALAALVARLEHSRALTAAVLLNPMLWFQYVSNAHNDLLGLALLVAALALVAAGRPWLATLFVAAAGLVKFPFMFVGAVAFARLGPRRALLYAGTGIVLALALSALFGGRPYLDALLVTGKLSGTAVSPLMRDVKLAFAAATVGLTLYVLLRSRFPAFGGFVFPAVAPVCFPWYLPWAIPYVLAARELVLPSLLALPVLGALADGIYGYHGFTLLVPLAALAWVVGLTLRRRPADG
jgi:hypothetical protein